MLRGASVKSTWIAIVCADTRSPDSHAEKKRKDSHHGRTGRKKEPPLTEHEGYRKLTTKSKPFALRILLANFAHSVFGCRTRVEIEIANKLRVIRRVKIASGRTCAELSRRFPPHPKPSTAKFQAREPRHHHRRCCRRDQPLSFSSYRR